MRDKIPFDNGGFFKGKCMNRNNKYVFNDKVVWGSSEDFYDMKCYETRYEGGKYRYMTRKD